METIWTEQSSEPPAAPRYHGNKTRERQRKSSEEARKEGREREYRKKKRKRRESEETERGNIYIWEKKEMFGKRNREGGDIWETESKGDVLSGWLCVCVCVCVCTCSCGCGTHTQM